MDYVKRKLEQARQQHVAEKIEQAWNQQKNSQNNAPGEGDPRSRFRRALSDLNISDNASAILAGVAAGVCITALAWWLKSDKLEIEPSSQKIDVLNERVELLGDNISELESRLKRLLAVTESIEEIEDRLASAQQQADSGADETVSAGASTEPPVAELAPMTVETVELFTPTHSVTARLNLRPSASLTATPIALLPSGTRVEKISEYGAWYYVNTETHGKGWCSSEYLSPLL
jgi:hypothetical protein